MLLKGWQKGHYAIISDFLKYLNTITSDFVLKGDTSLMICYNLDRFSEDIDLDAKRRDKDIKSIIDAFCKKYNYTYNVNKNTDTVKRFMIHYTKKHSKPLKVEISYRRKYIEDTEITNINGIEVYTIDSLCYMKSSAYQARDKIRDLYDVCFLCNHYWDSLSDGAINALRTSVEYKGVEQFDYIFREQSDELIDKDKLAEDFLEMYDKLGLLYTDEEKIALSKQEQNKSEKTSFFD